jgi:hypothetical protein
LAGPIRAVLGLGVLGLAIVGFGAAQPVAAASPSMSPHVEGRHVYDYGSMLSAHSVAVAEALAAHIESQGGGRVVLYTAPSNSAIPSTLARDWSVDGVLVTEGGSVGTLTLGETLKGKLGVDQASLVADASSTDAPTAESWMLSTLARIDGFLSGSHVFDGAGVFDANGKQQAEAAATKLAGETGTPVYIDVAIGGTDPELYATTNEDDIIDHLSGDPLVIALAVSGSKIGGSTNPFDLQTDSPWQDRLGSFSEDTPKSGDQSALLEAINAIHAVHETPPGPWAIVGFVALFFWVVPYWAIVASFRFGYRVRRLSPTKVASVVEGRVVLSGNVEPAWSVATSYFGKNKGVWYESSSARQTGRTWSWLFSESNAVPFLLNDGTGRILVLGRRARWDPAAGRADRLAGANDAVARAEGASEADIASLLDHRFVAAPDVLFTRRAKGVSQDVIDAGRRERYVAFGERVTVIGRAVPFSSSYAQDSDACPDGGQSLGLSGALVISSDTSTHLDILAGTPADVIKRGRFVVFLAVLGTITEVGCIVAAILLAH